MARGSLQWQSNNISCCLKQQQRDTWTLFITNQPSPTWKLLSQQTKQLLKLKCHLGSWAKNTMIFFILQQWQIRNNEQYTLKQSTIFQWNQMQGCLTFPLHIVMMPMLSWFNHYEIIWAFSEQVQYLTSKGFCSHTQNIRQNHVYCYKWCHQAQQHKITI